MPDGPCDEENTVRGLCKHGARCQPALLRARNLNVDIERIVCLNKCFDGPNMRIVGGEIFSEVSESDVGEILDRLEGLAGKAPADAASIEDKDDKIVFPGA